MSRSVFVLTRLPAAALFVCLSPLAAAAPQEGDQAADGPYRKPTIDVGVIVSDAEKSERFYEDVLGFEEVSEFSVDEKTAGDSGLTNYRTLHAHVMTIGEGEDATRIKLVEVPGAPPSRADNRFINSTYGPSYLTLHVRDMDPILKAAADNKLKPLAKGPVAIGEKGYLALLRDPDGNFIELVGPRPNFKPEPTPDESAKTAEKAEKTDKPADEKMNDEKAAAEKGDDQTDEKADDQKAENDDKKAEEKADKAAEEAKDVVEEAGDAAEAAGDAVEEAAKDE